MVGWFLARSISLKSICLARSSQEIKQCNSRLQYFQCYKIVLRPEKWTLMVYITVLLLKSCNLSCRRAKLNAAFCLAWHYKPQNYSTVSSLPWSPEPKSHQRLPSSHVGSCDCTDLLVAVHITDFVKPGLTWEYMSDAAVIAVARGCGSFIYLNLTGSYKITNDVVVALSHGGWSLSTIRLRDRCSSGCSIAAGLFIFDIYRSEVLLLHQWNRCSCSLSNVSIERWQPELLFTTILSIQVRWCLKKQMLPTCRD